MKFDIGYLFAVILCICAGVILGQGFSFDVKLSDLIALIATLITFTFAYQGLASNKAQYLNSIRPIVVKFETTDWNEYSYELKVNNVGTGAAIEVDIIFVHGGIEFTPADYVNYLIEKIGCCRVEWYSLSAIPHGKEFRLLNFTMGDKNKLDEVIEIVNKTSLNVTFSSIQHNEFSENFELGFD